MGREDADVEGLEEVKEDGKGALVTFFLGY